MLNMFVQIVFCLFLSLVLSQISTISLSYKIGIVIEFMNEQSKLQSTLSKPGLNVALVMRTERRRRFDPSVV